MHGFYYEDQTWYLLDIIENSFSIIKYFSNLVSLGLEIWGNQLKIN